MVRSLSRRAVADMLQAFLLWTVDCIGDRFVGRVGHQGQRTLTFFPTKDFRQEIVAPSAGATFHDDAVLARMLLQQ